MRINVLLLRLRAKETEKIVERMVKGAAVPYMVLM